MSYDTARIADATRSAKERLQDAATASDQASLSTVSEALERIEHGLTGSPVSSGLASALAGSLRELAIALEAPADENQVLEPKELFAESYERCIASDDFIPAFYRRFLATSPEVAAKFRSTDFEKQGGMLQRSLGLAAAAVAGESAGLRELTERARSHDRNHLDIRPELYDLWLDSIVQTASEFDASWCEDVEASWKIILGHVIAHMTAHY